LEPGRRDIIFSVELNRPAPEFTLPDLDGRIHRLGEYRGRIVIVNFWSCECPHSERTDRSTLACLVQWGPDVALLSIAANRNEPAGALAQAAQARRLPAVLLDADHAAADLYEALTTPHAFVIDRSGCLRYRGAVDDVTFRQRAPERFFLEEAVEALLEGRDPPLAETPAYGCAIVREV
jgi:peroxiredoxin